MNYGLSVIPLFILMGAFIHRANISDELYDAGYAWLGRFKGGLAMSTVMVTQIWQSPTSTCRQTRCI